MSVPAGYVVCKLCNHVYRPDVEDSVSGHRRGTGHTPVPAGPVTDDGSRVAVRADELPVTGPELLEAAARRISEQAAQLAALGELADTWGRLEGDTPWAEAAAQLRGMLTRPPVRALSRARARARADRKEPA